MPRGKKIAEPDPRTNKYSVDQVINYLGGDWIVKEISATGLLMKPKSKAVSLALENFVPFDLLT